MAEEYNPVLPSIFSDDPRTGALTYDQLQARRKVALALAMRQRAYPKTIGEGLSALGEGLGEGYLNSQLMAAEAAQTARERAALVPPSSTTAPATPPSVAPAVPRAPIAPRGTSVEGGEPTGETPVLASSAVADTDPLTAAQSKQQPQMPIEEWMTRIARNETGGERDPYSSIGPVSRRGDYPYGKYQVMGENIPKWTQQYLGQKMTPQEFLDNPQAQDQVARARGSEYVAKYGPTGAAAAWFAGENGMKDPNRKDTLGMFVNEYQRRFNIPLVTRNQVAASATQAPTDAENAPPYRVASLGDGTFVPDRATPDTGAPAAAAPSPLRDNIAQSMAGPQPQRFADAAPPIPQPQPSQQQFQSGPRVPAFPPYGPEPQPPQPTPDMIHYRRLAADPYMSPQTQQTAMQIYTEMKAAQDQEFARKYELWKANELKHRDYVVGLPKAQEDLTAAYYENLNRPQKTIAGQPAAPGAPGAAPGVQPQQPQQVDPRLGTSQSPQRTGVPTVPPVPAGIVPEKWAETQAPIQSQAVEAVQKAGPQFEDSIKAIQEARTHVGKQSGLGIEGVVRRQIPGTEAYAFGKINDQMVGKTFLTAYNTLKGGGQISNVEGEKAQTAQARIDPKQDPKNYDAALNDMEYQLRRDYETAQRKVNMPVTAWRAPGDNSSFAPDIGERRGNMEYIGGNPASPMSWKRVQ